MIRREMARQGRSLPELADVLGIGVEEAQSRHDGTRELGLDELRTLSLWLSVPIARLMTGLDERDAPSAR